MAEFQWWLLLVGLVAGGGLVAVVSMDGRRREEDVRGLERRAEANWIAGHLARQDLAPLVDERTVEAVLDAHREYLTLPPPDRLVVDGDAALEGSELLDGDSGLLELLDRDPDREADEVGHDGRGATDEDLPTAAEQQAATREEAHAGADREQRAD